ncbi:hypothetical protein OIO90_001766 [Microbotryomycetes sp. JL221]|nr:hypothetical protein OIO90_001766 [Microbotryomycetes sp. JL221]
MNEAALKRDNIAVVTGAAVGGIGFAISRLLLDRFGLKVVLADLSSELLNDATTELVKQGIAEDRFMTHVTDVTKYQDVAQLADVAFERFGRVDVLVLNAGVSRPSKDFVPPEDVESNLASWKTILDVNFFGVLHGTQAFVDRIVKQASPAAIVVTGSKQGITQPPGNPAYNVSKSAVKSLTESLAHSLLSTQVSVRLLVPGYTFTKLTGNVGGKDKPAAAWTPDQVAEELFRRWQQFYIICPDNDVTPALDSARMQWSMGDIIENRPALSRWHPEYSNQFAEFVESKVGSSK